MLNREFLSALICPKCNGEIKQYQPEEIFCSRCHQVYPIKNNIPFLVKNQEKLSLELKQKIGLRPDWYKGNQISSHDKGPYRHHLQKRVKYLFNILNKYNFVEPRICDVGCGDGINLRYLLKVPNAIVYGMDYNFTRLIRAQKNSNGQVFLILGSLLEENFRENYFDIILCNHVLEHIEKDSDVLMNLYKILKPGGILILGTPNEGAFLWQFNYKVVQPQIMRKTDHVHFYTAGRLEKLLKKAGFKMGEIKFIGWGLPHTRIDSLLRQYKWIDDLFEIIGSRIFKAQATSLYFICRK